MSERSCLIVTGGCLCRAHTFSVDVANIKFAFTSCHCSKCRLAHAAPFVQWVGLQPEHSTPDVFQLRSREGASLTAFRSTPICSRYFCSICGTHVYIKYDDTSSKKGRIDFPTAIIDAENILDLEVAAALNAEPRYEHIFYSDRHPCLGNLPEWAAAPKLGGETGLEPVSD